MRTLEELKTYYETTLSVQLSALEQQRQNTLNRLFNTEVIIAGATVMLFFGGWSLGFSDAPMICLILGAVAAVLAYIFIVRDYVTDFKKAIIAQIISFIDPNLSYDSASFIPESVFCRSQIFLTSADRYSGEDFVFGTLGLTAIQFSEILAQYQTRDSKGRTRYHTIFNGLFFVADFNKHFKSRTIVLPDTAERLLGHLGTMLQSMNAARPPLVRLDNPEFENLFAVYSDDPIEARYILSTSLMQRIMDFRQRINRSIYLSFVGSQIYIALPTGRNLFEPDIFKSLLNFEPIKKYYQDLSLALGIVEDLNLNLRIWSKE